MHGNWCTKSKGELITWLIGNEHELNFPNTWIEMEQEVPNMLKF